MPNLSRKTRTVIKKAVLEDLYIQKHLNLVEIGKLLGFCGRTIQILMHEHKIPLRPAGNVGPEIKSRDLEKLYLIQGLSSRKIAKIYKCAYSYVDSKTRKYGFPIKTLAGAHIKTNRKTFSGDLRDKAYLVGFRIGDLRVRKMYKNSETICIDCASTKPKQIELIRDLFEKYGHIWISKPTKLGKIQIEAHLDLSFSFLLPKFKEFPLWAIKHREAFLHILAGFIDAEGCFYINNRNQAGFSVGNYNKVILDQINNYLIKQYGYKTRLILGVRKGYTGKDGYPHRADYWMLSITKKKDLQSFTNLIMSYLKHEDRINCARKALNNIDERNLKYGFIGM